MRKTILAAVAAVSLAGLGAGATVARAQPAPPPAPPDMQGPPGPPPHWGGWMHRFQEHHGPHEGRGPLRGPGTFALVYRHADLHLTPPDVQKIAAAFLLWNGNHDWKVVDVSALQNGQIGFSYATESGAVVARFTMDPHTGRLQRVD